MSTFVDYMYFLFDDLCCAVEVIQHTALVWLHEFIQLAGCDMLPFAPGVLSAILPCFSYDDEIHRNIIEAARNVNSSLMKLVAGKSNGEEVQAMLLSNHKYTCIFVSICECKS